MSATTYPNPQAIFYKLFEAARRDEVVGILLALFLGTFGAHHFYLRRTGLGILYLCFFWSGIPAILGLIECFFMPGRVREFNAIQAAGIAAALGIPVPGWGLPVNGVGMPPGYLTAPVQAQTALPTVPASVPELPIRESGWRKVLLRLRDGASVEKAFAAPATTMKATGRRICEDSSFSGRQRRGFFVRGCGEYGADDSKIPRAVMLTRKGGPDVLQIVELPLETPGPGQLRVRVLAAGVGATDVAMLGGNYPFAPKIPFVPGYEVAGTVDAIGAGVTGFELGQRVAALTVYGSFAEFLVREAEHFLPVPDEVSDRDAAAVILNYGTAWQMIHRVARVRAGQTALVTGAAGGVGTAALQLLRLAGVKTYGAASEKKHEIVRSLGAIPIDYRSGRLDRLARAMEPEGVDFVFDAVGGANIGPCIGALRRGGLVVGFGFLGAPGILPKIAMFFNLFVGARLRGQIAGTSLRYFRALQKADPRPLREDLPKIFALLAEKKIDPLVTRTFALLEARQAIELVAAGTVEGKIVLTNS